MNDELTKRMGDRAPKQWVESADRRVVTGCWVEYCIVSDGIATPSSERLLDRPLPYEVPLPGEQHFVCGAGRARADDDYCTRCGKAQDPHEYVRRHRDRTLEALHHRHRSVWPLHFLTLSFADSSHHNQAESPPRNSTEAARTSCTDRSPLPPARSTRFPSRRGKS